MANPENQSNKRSRILPLVVVVALAGFFVCITVWLLSRRPQQSGEILSLSGVVRYTDGTPAAHTPVELHSAPRATVTDEKGYFFFHLSHSGAHELFVVNGQGEVLASCPVKITADNSANAVSILYDGESGYTVEIPVNVLLVELEVILTDRETPGMELGTVTAIQTDGTVLTPNGAARPEENRTLATEQGHTVFDDGTVLLPDGRVLLNNGTLVETDGAVTHPDGEAEKSNDVIWTENNAAVLPGGTVLTSGGHVITNKTDIIHPDGYIIFEDGTVADSADGSVTLPDGTVIDQKENTVVLPDGTVIDQKAGTVTPPADPSIPTPTEPKPTDPTSAPDNGKVNITSEGKNWTQNTVINLFAGIDRIYPGMEGSYTFEVSNTRREAIVFSMTVSDNSTNAIPFVLTLKDASGDVAALTSLHLAANSSVTYTLYWQWRYESGDDAYDTMLGESADHSHTVTITIRAESAA